MRDRVFEWSLTGVTVAVIAWIVCSIILLDFHPAAAIFSGIAIELAIGIPLLWKWGRGYMERTR